MRAIALLLLPLALASPLARGSRLPHARGPDRGGALLGAVPSADPSAVPSAVPKRQYKIEVALVSGASVGSGLVAASSGAVAAWSSAVAASSGAVAASSGAVTASSGAVVASSGAVAASSNSSSSGAASHTTDALITVALGTGNASTGVSAAANATATRPASDAAVVVTVWATSSSGSSTTASSGSSTPTSSGSSTMALSGSSAPTSSAATTSASADLSGGNVNLGAAADPAAASAAGDITIGGNVYAATTLEETSVSTLVETIVTVGGGGATSEASAAKPTAPAATSTSASTSAAASAQTLDATAQAWLDAHNAARAQYGAAALAWNSGLIGKAQANAEQCNMQHSNGGENIAGASGALSPQEAVQMWMDESVLYDWSDPVYADATGHFTQVVWKASTEVACHTATCAPGTLFKEGYGVSGTTAVLRTAPDGQTSYQATCEYDPAGDVTNDGYFAANVGTNGS